MSNPSLGKIEESVINASLNGQLLANMQFGTYTAVYTYTMYIYMNKKSSRNWLVIGGISLSYLAYLLQISLEWAFTKIALVNDGETRQSAFIQTLNPPDHKPKGSFVYEVTLFTMAAIADALMIWRCYSVWDCSVRIILFPSFLLFCEIVLDISIIGVLSAEGFVQTHAAHNMLGGAIFVTFLTTFIATVLIAYRIHTLATKEVSRNTKALVRHILEILLQSAAAYCLVSLATAISVTLATAINGPLSTHTAVLYANQEYVVDFWAFTAGVAPTVMVARTTLGSSAQRDIVDASAVNNISGLRFHGHTVASQVATRSRMATEGVLELENGSDPSLDPKELTSKEGGLGPVV